MVVVNILSDFIFHPQERRIPLMPVTATPEQPKKITMNIFRSQKLAFHGVG